MTTGETIILSTCITFGIVNLLFIYRVLRNLDNRLFNHLKTTLQAHEDFFRASQRIYWTHNKSKMTKYYQYALRLYFNYYAGISKSEIRFPIGFNITAETLDYKIYPCSTEEIFNLSGLPDYIDTRSYLICKQIDESKDVYVLVATGPISSANFKENYRKLNPITLDISNYKFLHSYKPYSSHDESVVGYLVNKNDYSTLPLSTDEVTDNKVEEFKSSLNYCKYLLDILESVDISKEDEVYTRYNTLIDKDIVIPNEDDEVYLKETLSLIDSKHGDKLRLALGGIG